MVYMHHGPHAAGDPCSGGSIDRHCPCILFGPPPPPVREVDTIAIEKLAVVAHKALERVTTIEVWMADPGHLVPPRGAARETYALMLSLIHALGRLRDGQGVPETVHDEMLGVPWDVIRRQVNEIARTGVTFAA